MKVRISIIALLFLCLNNSFSQKIYGVYRDTPDVLFASLDLETEILSPISVLPNVTSIQASSTFDSRNSRYAIKTNLGISIISVLNGSIIKNIPVPNRFTGIQFGNNDNIYGVMWDGTDELFISLDIKTEVLQTLGVLENVSSIQSETTYDMISDRYFINTNLGITIVNATDGSIIKNISNPENLKSIQYNCINEIFGVYRKGSELTFASVNIESEILKDISALSSIESHQSPTTYDVINDRYVINTNLGTTNINTNNGSIINNIATLNNSFTGMEFESSCILLIDSCGSFPWDGN